MQHINDDMDDLLRNAAEDYPLKISGANWDAIAGKLATEEGKDEIAPIIVMQASKTRFYKYAALLLLIPLAYMAAKYAGYLGTTTNTGIQPGKTNTVIAKGANGTNVGTKIITTPAQSGVKIPTVGTDTTVPNNTVASETASAGQSQTIFRMRKHGANVVGGDNGSGGQNPVNKSVALGGNKDILAGKKGDKMSSSPAAENINPNSNVNDRTNGVEPEELTGVHAPNNNAATTAANTSATATAPIVHPAKVKRFYIGAYVAPEYTTVKYQPGSKIGFTFGGLFGYKLSKFVSVEAGIAVGKKYYTSDGKYFNSDVSWVRNWDKVLSISGYATLTEFPVTIRYNFKPSREGNFFVATGLVSYVVHQENYNYLVDKNGSQYSITKTPVVSTTNFLSDVSVSGGYESSLGNLCNFRIEPYYRIPLKGIGIGGLPITSIGLNIGVTKKIK